MALTGCQTLGMGGSDKSPTLTRTGQVKDILIQDTLSPETLTAMPGDEIRWINRRQGNASVVLLSPVEPGQLSCERGFGGMMGGNKKQYTASLGTNDSASICFKDAAEIKYVVRADSYAPGGEKNMAGTITVGEGQTSSADENKGRVSQADSDKIQ
ncbi:MAG: hypothetical protein ACXWWF_11500 [Nitrospira sp.]